MYAGAFVVWDPLPFGKLKTMTTDDKPKRGPGRPEKSYSEQIDASPEEIARVAFKAKSKKDWRYMKEDTR